MVDIEQRKDFSLLPKDLSEFSKSAYWDHFFSLRKSAFEWYGEYSDYGSTLSGYLKATDNILQIGCGNSQLADHVYDAGFTNVTSVDLSDAAIQLQETNHARAKVKRPSLKFLKADATDMRSLFAAGQFNAVVDKGTLDALLGDSLSEEAVRHTERMFAEVTRVLQQPGGRYVVISLAQDHVLQTWAAYFAANATAILRVVQLTNVQPAPDSSGQYRVEKFKLPVYVFVVTFLKPMPNFQTILEFVDSRSMTQKCSSVDDLCLAVRSAQEYFQFCHRLQVGKLPEERHTTLYSAAPNSKLGNGLSEALPRFEISFVDQANTDNGKYGVFIVPQGRDVEYLFATSTGRLSLANQAGFGRLVVVRLARGQNFKDMKSVQNELNGVVMDYAPFYHLKDSARSAPFLTMSNDVGQRVLLYEGASECNGDFLVEDVKVEHLWHRRLIFLNSPSLFQSEARLRLVGSDTASNGVAIKQHQKKRGKNRNAAKSGEDASDRNGASVAPDHETSRFTVDHSHLCCEHHRVMLLAYGLFVHYSSTKVGEKLRICVIGLGGGSLPMFLHKELSEACITCIELDPAVKSVAKQFFDFHESDNVQVKICDGVAFLAEQAACADASFDLIFVDAATSDGAEEISCPPAVFLSEDCLSHMKKLLGENGVLALNLATRSEARSDAVLSEVAKQFPSVLVNRVPEQTNRIVFCLPQKKEGNGPPIAPLLRIVEAKFHSKTLTLKRLTSEFGQMRLK